MMVVNMMFVSEKTKQIERQTGINEALSDWKTSYFID